MQTTAFTALSPGHTVPTVNGAIAFVPHSAPRELRLEAPTVRLLERAMHQLGVLTGAAKRVVNPYLISSPLLRQEAILSSRIEGTIATPEQLALEELGSDVEHADAKEVGNFARASQHALRAIGRGEPITGRLLLATHKILMSEVRGDHERPGEYRDAQNFIGTSKDIHAARFVPPPHTEIGSLMSDFESFVNSDTPALPDLVTNAIAHYQFETIHPFRDGNGRIGRLLVTLLSVRDGLIPGPILPISSHLERNKQAYADYLLGVSTGGAWQPWIAFFLEAVIHGAEEASGQVEGLMALRSAWQERFQSARSSALLLKLLDHLFQRPAVTIGRVAKLLRVTPAAASANIKKLVEAGVLREITGRTRNQVFLAQDILDFIGGKGARPLHETSSPESFRRGQSN